jgi:tetratricopeptide (TPR) repeat protein
MHASASALPSATPSAHGPRVDFWIMFVLAAVTVGLYARTANFGYIDYDDSNYYYANTHLSSGLTWNGIWWALTVPYSGNWHPLTWIVYMAEVSLFGIRAGPVHVLNFCLHAANAVLLFDLLRRMTGRRWPAAIAAALFAWYPLRVESVAWVSETKDVLAALFFLLTLIAYFQYVQRPGLLRYAAVASALALALMSKPSVVTLPCVLLLLDYWPLDRGGSLLRWWKLLLEKLPLFLITAGASKLVYHAQDSLGATKLNHIIPLSNRLANAAQSLGIYLLKFFWPARLTVFYPHPFLNGTPIPPGQIIASIGTILAITILAVKYRRSKPYLIVGWLWFLGTLVPMLGLIQAGAQAMADRYSYLPDIGLTAAIVFLASDLLSPRTLLTSAICACATISIATEIQISYWRDNMTLFTRCDQLTERNFEARAILAFDLLQSGQADQALPLAQSAVEICPVVPTTYHVLGMVLQAVGRQHEAVAALESAHHLDQFDPAICNDMGALLVEMNLNANAAKWFQRAIDLQPTLVAARQNLAMSLAAQGKIDQAIAQWRAAVAIDPKFAVAYGWLAVALERQGDRSGAIEHFSAAVNNGERRPEWLTELAWMLATDPHSTTDQIQQALAYATEACDKTNNTDAKALDSRAAALARLIRFDEAAATAAQAIDAANAAHDPALAKAIETRMMGYRDGEPYIAAK